MNKDMLGELDTVCKSEDVDKKSDKIDDQTMSGPQAKKLKQAVLSFTKITDNNKFNGPSISKKRKLPQDASTTAGKADKKARCADARKDVKSCGSQQKDENEVSSSSEAEFLQRMSPDTTEKQSRKTFGILDNFVRTTQIEEVSTSCKDAPLIDLTDSPLKPAVGKEPDSQNAVLTASNAHQKVEAMDDGEDCVILESKSLSSEDSSDSAKLTKDCSVKIRRISDSYINGTKSISDLLKSKASSNDENDPAALSEDLACINENVSSEDKEGSIVDPIDVDSQNKCKSSKFSITNYFKVKDKSDRTADSDVVSDKNTEDLQTSVLPRKEPDALSVCEPITEQAEPECKRVKLDSDENTVNSCSSSSSGSSNNSSDSYDTAQSEQDTTSPQPVDISRGEKSDDVMSKKLPSGDATSQHLSAEDVASQCVESHNEAPESEKCDDVKSERVTSQGVTSQEAASRPPCPDELQSPVSSVPLDTSCLSTCSSTGSSPKTPASTPQGTKKPVSASKKNSSAKKLEKENERKKKIEEKERLRQEKLKKKEETKMEKEKAKKLEQEKKEQERLKKEKEKQEKKEQLEREKEEKRKVKEEELRKKQEVIDAKNEEKRKREEEKKKKEVEKQKEATEKTKKKEHVQKVFKSFFVKSEKPMGPVKVAEDTSSPFFAFEVKKDMSLAPSVWVEITDRDNFYQELDSLMQKQDHEHLYLAELRSGTHKPKSVKSCFRSRPVDETELEIMDDDNNKPGSQRMRAKLLQFRENYRPAYYGTWRKKSSAIKPRNPFVKAEGELDYEVDSDEEWEEEEPGESLSNSEGEVEQEEDEDDEDTDGFFVPHGYLSEGEGCEDEEEEVTPEQLKARQIAKARAWDAEMQKQFQPIKAIVIGCVWTNNDESSLPPDVKKILEFKAVYIESCPILVGEAAEQAASGNGGSQSSQQTPSSANKGANKKSVPESAMADLVRLVHGNTNGVKTLIKEFREFWRIKNQSEDKEADPKMEVDEGANPEVINSSDATSTTPSRNVTASSPITQENGGSDISKRQLEMKIRAIAEYEKRSTFKRVCWFVNDSVLKEYNLTDLPVPTQWHYLTRPNVEQKENDNKKPVEGRKTPTISQFAVPRSQLPPERNSPVAKVGAELKEKDGKKTPTIMQFTVPRSQLPTPTQTTSSAAKLSTSSTDDNKAEPLSVIGQTLQGNSPAVSAQTPTSQKPTKATTPRRISTVMVRSSLKFSSPVASPKANEQPELTGKQESTAAAQIKTGQAESSIPSSSQPRSVIADSLSAGSSNAKVRPQVSTNAGESRVESSVSTKPVQPDCIVLLDSDSEDGQSAQEKFFKPINAESPQIVKPVPQASSSTEKITSAEPPHTNKTVTVESPQLKSGQKTLFDILKKNTPNPPKSDNQ